MLFVIRSFSKFEIFSEKILRFLFMVFFDLKMGPILLNKYEKIFLLILILKIKPTMKKK